MQRGLLKIFGWEVLRKKLYHSSPKPSGKFLEVLVLLFTSLLISFGGEVNVDKLVEKYKRDGKVVLNFESVDISTVARLMSELTGKNIVLPGNISGKITINSTKPVSVKEAWDIFTSLLSTMGFATTEEDGVVKVLTSSNVPSIAGFGEPTSGGDVKVFVYTASYANAQQLLNVIRPFLSSFARVAVDNQTNTLILADIGANIQKAREILEVIDSEEKSFEVKIYRLNYLSVQDAVRTLNTLAGSFGRAGVQVQVTSSEEAGSVIVVAPRKVHTIVERILSKLDTEEILEEQRSFYVIPLRYTSAKEISETVRGIFTTGRQGFRPKPRIPHRPKGKGKNNKGKRVSAGISSITSSEGMTISFDEGTNSVLIYGTKEEFEEIKSLIEKLDVRRKQVLIAATVVEASTKKLLDIGVRWQVIGTQGAATFRGGSSNDIYSSLLSGNFIMGVFSTSGETVSVAGTELFFPELAFLFSLMEQGSGFNILSTPKVLTLDNKEANIKVGQVVPFASGVKFDVNGQPIITYDYKEVGLDLKVVPHISEENLRLSIKLSLQEIIDFISPQVGGLSYTVPVTSNREINSDVFIENGETIILGGLVSSKTLRSVDGVPKLKDVPLLGRLFKKDVKQDDRTTLFIFITPHVISSPQDLSKLTEQHKKFAENVKKLVEGKEKTEEYDVEEDF